MKQDHHTTLTGIATTPADVCRWVQALFRLHARIAPRFARPEPRRRALAYLQGILSDTSRKNGWQLAEHAREARPDGMQRLLGSAVWDTDGVRDDLRSYVLEQLGRESAIAVIDETSFPKRGQKSAGVGLQYCGTTGRVENCQVGVFLSYVTAKGHTLIDRELYLPCNWCEDRERCRAAGIPESVRLQTKPELAVQMLERLWKAAVAISWVVADTVYGGNLDLRNWLEAHAYHYVLAVACNEPVGIVTPDGQRRRVEVCEVEVLLLHQQDWQRLSMSEGTKGPRLFDWAVVPILHQWEDDGRHWLLIRRSLTDPNEQAYYFVFAPKGTTLPGMVAAIGARWHIEVRRVGAYGIPVKDREGREHKHLQNNGLPGGETHKRDNSMPMKAEVHRKEVHVRSASSLCMVRLEMSNPSSHVMNAISVIPSLQWRRQNTMYSSMTWQGSLWRTVGNEPDREQTGT